MAVISLTNASNAAAPIAEVPVASKENTSPPDEISEPAPMEASAPVSRQSAAAPSQVDRAPSRATPAHHPTAGRLAKGFSRQRTAKPLWRNFALICASLRSRMGRRAPARPPQRLWPFYESTQEAMLENRVDLH